MFTISTDEAGMETSHASLHRYTDLSLKAALISQRRLMRPLHFKDAPHLEDHFFYVESHTLHENSPKLVSVSISPAELGVAEILERYGPYWEDVTDLYEKNGEIFSRKQNKQDGKSKGKASDHLLYLPKLVHELTLLSLRNHKVLTSEELALLQRTNVFLKNIHSAFADGDS